MTGLSRVPLRCPRTVLAVMAIVAVTAGVLGWSAPSHLSFKLRDLYSHDSESFRTMHQLETARPKGSPGAPDLIVIVERPSELAARRIGRELAGLPQIAGVSSYSFPSVDGQSYDVFAWLKDGLEEGPAAAGVADAIGNNHVVVGSPVLARRQLGEQIEGDVGRAELIAFPLLLILGLWVFGSPVAALLPVVVGGGSLLCTLGAIRALDGLFPLSVFSLNIAAALALGLGVDYSLLMVSRFREELASGRHPRSGAVATVRTAGRTVAFSGAVIATSFSSLLVFPVPLARSVAVGGILVAAIACVIALVALPALFCLLGTRINALALRRRRRTMDTASHPSHRGFWYRLALAVMRRPVMVAVTVSALLIALAMPSSGMRFTGFDVASVSSSADARAFTEQIRGEFTSPLIGEIEIAIHGDRATASHVEARLDALSERTGLATPFPIPYRLSSNLWRMSLNPSEAPLSDETQRFVQSLRAMDLPITVTGETAAYMDVAAALKRDLPLALTILVTGSFLFLLLATRSLVLPVKALLMNVLSLGAALGLLVLVFQDGRLEGLLGFQSQGALIVLLPIVVAAGAFGLLTDYGLFLIMRIREAREEGLDDRQAVALGLERTGRIVTAAALLFSAAVGAFATSGLMLVKAAAFGIVAAVLLDAFVVRSLLVPSLMAILGKWNWWPRDMPCAGRPETDPGKVELAPPAKSR